MQPGSQLAGGRYILESSLKRTGMAEVWLAKQRGGGGFSKQVIVKMIHPDLNEQSEARRRFLDEARLASQIQHPHVVQIHDFGEEDNGLLFLVMEYIQGHDLETIIRQAKEDNRFIPLPIILRLMADACQGLGFIHDMTDDHGNPMELVHRDISPQNLVVSYSGGIKIIDFGIVKARTKSSRTRTGVIVGKLQYMSPEQLSSEELDRRSDIYSLGLVLYELLTLTPRFRGKNMLEVFYEALNEPPPTVTDLRPDCPPDIVQCVQTALAQKKEHRYNNAYEMQSALENALMRIGTPTTHRDIAQYLKDPSNFAGVSNAGIYTPAERTTQVSTSELLDAPLTSSKPDYSQSFNSNPSQNDDFFQEESSLDHTFSGFVNESVPLDEDDSIDSHTLGSQPLQSPFADTPSNFDPPSDFANEVPLYDNMTIQGEFSSSDNTRRAQNPFTPSDDEEHSETVVFSLDDDNDEGEETVVAAASVPYSPPPPTSLSSAIDASSGEETLLSTPSPLRSHQPPLSSMSADATLPPIPSPHAKKPKAHSSSEEQNPFVPASSYRHSTPAPSTTTPPPRHQEEQSLRNHPQNPRTSSTQQPTSSQQPAKKEFPILWILLIILTIGVIGMGITIVYLLMS